MRKEDYVDSDGFVHPVPRITEEESAEMHKRMHKQWMKAQSLPPMSDATHNAVQRILAGQVFIEDEQHKHLVLSMGMELYQRYEYNGPCPQDVELPEGVAQGSYATRWIAMVDAVCQDVIDKFSLEGGIEELHRDINVYILNFEEVMNSTRQIAKTERLLGTLPRSSEPSA